MHLRLTIDLEYNLPENASSGELDELYDMLHEVPKHAFANGLFTGDTDAGLNSKPKCRIERYDPAAAPAKVAELLTECAAVLDCLHATNTRDLAARCRTMAKA